jgi:hypothetical protein
MPHISRKGRKRMADRKRGAQSNNQNAVTHGQTIAPPFAQGAELLGKRMPASIREMDPVVSRNRLRPDLDAEKHEAASLAFRTLLTRCNGLPLGGGPYEAAGARCRSCR